MNMNMKSQIAIAGLLFAGLLASGCSQQQAAGSQQTASAQQTQQAAETPVEVAPAPVAPAPAPVAPAPAPVVPKVKAKGNYKGAVMMDPASAAAMDAYKQ